MYFIQHIGSVALLLACCITVTQTAPIDVGASIEARDQQLESRQNIYTPVVNITDLNLSEISPIEDGFLEQDNDAGGESDAGAGGTAVSNSNGFLGTVGSGQAAQNPNGAEGTSAACGLMGCATSGAAANNQSTSSSSSSSGGIQLSPTVNNNSPLINGPLISMPRDLARRWLAAVFRRGW